MIQSGVLTTIDSTTGQSTGVPVRGAWINFVQDNVTKATVQTNIKTGAYSVDVPLGKYAVKIAVGDVSGIQRAGQLFELKTGDKADAFHKWLYGETGSIDDDLLKQFKQISSDISTSANRAENAEKGAKQIKTSMSENGYVATKQVSLAYLFGSPANGKYYTVDNDPDFIGMTPENRSAAYVEVINSYHTTGIYIKLVWAYSTQGKKTYEIRKESGVWQTSIEDLKGESIGDTNGKFLKEGAYGIGGSGANEPSFNDFYSFPTDNFELSKFNIKSGHYSISREMINGYKLNGNPAIYTGQLEVRIRLYRAGDEIILKMHEGGVCYINIRQSGRWTGWFQDLNEKNTTIDSNGFIKKASPIIKLFDDHIEWNQDFKEDPIFEKISPGIYKISNTHGLAREGWTYEKPRGKDGNTYFKIKVQKLDDGCIISVHDYFVDYEDVIIIDDVGNKRTVKRQIEVLSQARDIKPEERWIDLRFFEKIYDLTNEPPKINIPYHPLWGIEPYIPPVVEPIEEDIALKDQRAF